MVTRESGTLLLLDGEDSLEEVGYDMQRHRSRKAVTSSIVALALALVAGAAAFTSLRERSPQTHARGDVVRLDADRTHQCRTAAKGETCYLDVKWAQDIGMKDHADWYQETCPNLRLTDSFEDYQACVYKINATSCPLPCAPGAKKVSTTMVRPTHRNQAPAPALPAVLQATLAPTAAPAHPCHIADQDDRCYEVVVTAMLTGLTEHPEWFSTLTRESTFEEFQAALHQGPHDTTCPRPCKCHTARVNETCYAHVHWALTEGISDHPQWFAGLNAGSTFEDVQEFMHKDARDVCPRPCSPVTFKSLRGEALRDGLPMPEIAAISSALEGMCRTAEKGTKCHKSIVYAMNGGLREHPDWYPHMTMESSFEDFQALLVDNPELDCPKPCKCETAKKGSKCSDNVKWVLKEGMEKHPDWYPGLTENSRWEDVQARLFEDEQAVCSKPCSAKEWGSPSIFCFAVFRSTGYEVDLVRAQSEKAAGIFSCDEFAVLSDKELSVTDSVKTLIIPPCEDVGVSKDGTAANTLIFMQAWTVIFDDVRYKAHDWIVKADPDAVVIVDRLRNILAKHNGPNVWMKNCMKWTGPGWPMMFGSLEAFSIGAMEVYFEGAQKCRDQLNWESWGEDLFMGNCLSMLGGNDEYDQHLIGDNVCKGANCADGVSAGYHPFKTVEDWFGCYNEARGVPLS